MKQLLPLTLATALAVELDPAAKSDPALKAVRTNLYQAWSVVRGHNSVEVSRVGYMLWRGIGFDHARELGFRLLAALPDDEDVQFAFIAGTSTSSRPREDFDRSIQLVGNLGAQRPRDLRVLKATFEAFWARSAKTKSAEDSSKAIEALSSLVRLMPSDYPREYREHYRQLLRDLKGGAAP